MPWYEWPEPLGLIPLAIYRDILEHNNLLEAPGVELPALSAFANNVEDLPEPSERPDDGYGMNSISFIDNGVISTFVATKF